MGLLDYFRNNKKESAITKAPVAKQTAAPVKAASAAKTPAKGQLDKKLKGDTKQAYRVLVKPLLTEKSTATGTYYFMVDKHTNKAEIKKALQALYGVLPAKINIINYGGKKVRWGRQAGSTKAWKKAIVTLRAGDKIEIYGN